MGITCWVTTSSTYSHKAEASGPHSLYGNKWRDEVPISKQEEWPHWAFMKNQFESVRCVPKLGSTYNNWARLVLADSLCFESFFRSNTTAPCSESKWVRDSLEKWSHEIKWNTNKADLSLPYLSTTQINVWAMKCMVPRDNKLELCFLKNTWSFWPNSAKQIQCNYADFRIQFPLANLSPSLPYHNHSKYCWPRIQVLFLLFDTKLPQNPSQHRLLNGSYKRVVGKKYLLLAILRIEKWVIDV